MDSGVRFKAILWRPADRTARAGLEETKDAVVAKDAETKTVPASTSPARHEPAVLLALAGMPDRATRRGLMGAPGLSERQVW